MISQQDESVEYSPAFIVAAYFDNILNQNVWLDCGATCSIISEKLLTQVKTKLCNPKRELSVSGINNKVKIKGFTRIWIDFGQGVKLQHTVLAVESDGGAYTANPYIANPYIANPYIANPYIANSYTANPPA